jgi:hypothetical protein
VKRIEPRCNEKEIPTVFKNGGKCPQRAATDPYFSQIDAEEYLFYNSG